MNDSQIIDVSNVSKFTTYEQDFIIFCEDNAITTPNINTLKGQVIALLTKKENRNKYIDREKLDSFLKSINMFSADSIQIVNKTDQWGLKHQTVDRKWYNIPYPFEFIDIHIKKRKISFQVLDRDSKIDFIKEYIKFNYLDVPNYKWEIGHKDPNKPTSDDNLVLQPPIQGKFRDRFKFDDIGLIKYPTPQELDRNPFLYYSQEEWIKIIENYKKRLDL
jgi:hypothetical protein